MARNKYPEETIKLIIDKSLELFMQKGYDNTSIQDIVNNLGGLSKGAIYHHFNSKQEIFDAIAMRIGQQNIESYEQIRNESTLNGYQKLKKMFIFACENPNNYKCAALYGTFMKDPKFIVSQIEETMEMVVPKFVQPVLEQGVRDGSIKTDYPKELAEVVMILMNFWCNPGVISSTIDELRRKLEFFSILLKGIGIDFFNDELVEMYTKYCSLYQI